MRICVTGGAGYIGSALVIDLLKMGHEVDVFDWKPREKWPNFDYLNGHLYGNLFHAKQFSYDMIFHLAALAGNPICDKMNKAYVQGANIDACTHIVEHTSPETIIIYASTSAIYGKQGLYAQTKKEGEDVFLFRHPKSICLRLATIYGISPSLRENIIVHDFVKSALRKNYIVVRNRTDTRPFMTLEDCVKLITWFTCGPQRYYGKAINLFGSYSFASKGHIAELISRITGCEILYSKQEDIYPQNFAIDKNSTTLSFYKERPPAIETITPIVDYYDR